LQAGYAVALLPVILTWPVKASDVGYARSFQCYVCISDSIGAAFAKIRSIRGEIEVLLVNAGSRTQEVDIVARRSTQ
jgi:hypothetical protein